MTAPVLADDGENLQAASSAKKTLAEIDEGTLVNQDITSMLQRIRELERRVAVLEQDDGFQDERIRNLDRNVNDIKRRSLR